MVRSRSSAPEARSRRVATEVTRNITVNGKMPSSGAPMESKVVVPLKLQASSAMSTQGMTIISASVRRSWRSCPRTRRAVANVHRALIPGPPARREHSAPGGGGGARSHLPFDGPLVDGLRLDGLLLDGLLLDQRQEGRFDVGGAGAL